MERTLAQETVKKVGKKIKLFGWVDRRRDHGKLVFIDLRDRSGIVQVVGGSELGELRPQDAIEVIGKIQKRPKDLVNKDLKTGEIEVQVEEIKILSKAASLPFDMGKEALELELPTLLDHRALTIRHKKVRAIFEVQEVVIDAFRKSLKKIGFTEYESPIIVPATAEGGAEVFPVKYFKYNAFLGQSPQLYKQMMLGAFERVFTVTHAFRAEPSVTTRHITEYASLDAEMAFIDSWEEIMDTAEYVIKEILDEVGKQCKEQLKMHQATIPLVSKRIPRVTLKEALEIIYKRTKRDNRGEPDLEPVDEEEICQWAKEEKGTEFVFITHYPVKKRPFYTYPDPKNPDLTLSFDLVGRGLEWITGGQRIHEYEKLVENIKKWGNDPKDFALYLEAFKYGMPPGGGFAIGAERTTMKILGLKNIREATPFPRDMERVDIRLSTIKSPKKSKKKK
jgi:nondiscriminating aspartyl-tRNA synthetase